MSFNPLSGCLRCRITSQLAKNADSWLLRPSLASALPNLNYTTRRHRVDRAGGGSKSKSKHFNRGQGQGGKKPWGRRDAEPESHYQGAASLVYKPLTPPSLDADVDSPPALDSEHLYDFFLKRVTAFSTHSPTHDRLQGFGIPPQDVGRLLRAFAQTAQSGHFTTSPDTFAHYGLSRLGEGQPAGDQYAALAYGDKILTHACYKWAADPVVQAELRDKYNLSQPALDSITRLYDAADKSNLSEQFVEARRIRRKIIMHVGPTNSGKTFNALRALAAAKRGVYAGPLRLLAHEIWERLNLGEIPPLGAEIPEVLDGAKAKDRANPAHARLTNMITGEEQKIVDEFAPLLTCTVEMLSPIVRYDVAVIDEIQMIADPERGGGWTAAVLGLCADELHLCGEDTAIPLIEAIARMTGDELIINRYERLTPLVVEDKPLGKITNVQPGDCIVTFSRKGIFSVKDQIQEQTGMKCVVAYGMLPPEIRSEQAALFNDPDSGYDIIIGSDAIGMGLNLKIKRIIFEKASKFNGRSDVPLTVSQVKQIAGRAGRFGQHSSGGLVTTLHANDLAFVKRTLSKALPPLTHARVNVSQEDIARIAAALPSTVKTQYLFEAHAYVGNLNYGGGGKVFKFQEVAKMGEMAEVLDKMGPDFTLKDRAAIVAAPVPWKDYDGVHVVQNILNSKTRDMVVSLEQAFDEAEIVEALSTTEQAMARAQGAADVGVKPPTVKEEATQESLKSLEKLHRCLVLYLWLSYRNPVTYYDYDNAMTLKGRVEVALDWCLASLSAEEAEKKQKKQRRVEYKDGFQMQKESVKVSQVLAARHEDPTLGLKIV